MVLTNKTPDVLPWIPPGKPQVQDISALSTRLADAKAFQVFHGRKVAHEKNKSVYNFYALQKLNNCSQSRRRAEKVDKRMVLGHTHGLFIT